MGRYTKIETEIDYVKPETAILTSTASVLTSPNAAMTSLASFCSDEYFRKMKRFLRYPTQPL